MNRRVLIVGLLVVLPLVGILLANLGRDPQAIATPLVGKEAPAFTLPPLAKDGAPVGLASLRGRPVILNFWASWCAPCQLEHPVLVQAARDNPDVSFLGIVYEDEPERAQAFLDRLGSGYPSLLDPQGQTAIAYGIAGVPETYFIDRDGRIVAKFVAPIDDNTMAQALELVKKGP